MTPVEAFIDLCLETDGRVVLQWPLLNQDLDAIEEMITSDVVLMGLADAGAHVGQIIDASQPTYFLTYWVRERAVMTDRGRGAPAHLGHRGVHGPPGSRACCGPGAFADVNVIDWDRLGLAMPEFVHDFPYGAGRWTQQGTGYDATIVNGQVAFEGGEHTGAFAGTVLRSGPDARDERATKGRMTLTELTAATKAAIPSGPEELWGESWYLDWAAADASYGGYVRLGLYPNLGLSWWWIALVGADRPLVLVVDHELPCPEGDAALVAGGRHDERRADAHRAVPALPGRERGGGRRARRSRAGVPRARRPVGAGAARPRMGEPVRGVPVRDDHACTRSRRGSPAPSRSATRR